MHPTPNLVTPPKIQNAVQDPGQPPHPSTNPFCATPPLQVNRSGREELGGRKSGGGEWKAGSDSDIVSIIADTGTDWTADANLPYLSQVCWCVKVCWCVTHMPLS